MIVRYLGVPILAVAAAVAVATSVLAAPGDITLASTADSGVKGNTGSEVASLSADGTKVAFTSGASNLDPGDTDGLMDIYVKDLTTGDITLASTSDAGVKADAHSFEPSISADGTKVAFRSFATNLDPSGAGGIYVKDLTTGDITLASTSDAGVAGNNVSFEPSISSDGTRVAFHSAASNLDPGDIDGLFDVYVKDLTTGDITLASTSDTGVKGNGQSVRSSISADGTSVAFESNATNLDPGDTDGVLDVYVADLATGDITLASTSDTGVKGNSSSVRASISSDGTEVAFDSATNLDPDDTNGVFDVYVKNLTTGDITLASTSDAGVVGNDHSIRPSISSAGTSVAFDSFATNLDPGDADSVDDIYVKELGSTPTGSADLSVTKSDGRGDPATVGSRLTYKVLVRNLGPDAATGVTLTDELPDGVTFVRARTRQGTCAHAGGIVTCDLGTLASDVRVNVKIIVTPNSPGTITNTAEVSGNEADPNTANNQDSETTTVQ